jgi:hypothetical protein
MDAEVANPLSPQAFWIFTEFTEQKFSPPRTRLADATSPQAALTERAESMLEEMSKRLPVVLLPLGRMGD